MEVPRPTVSTGTIPEGMSKDTFQVRFVWRGRTKEETMSPDFIGGRGKRVEGWRRVALAGYLVLRDGNGCSIRSPLCEIGEQPFASPVHADFDHIDGNRRNHFAKNLRLACHPCNSSQQKFQWKSGAAPASANLEKERRMGASVSPTDKRILDLSRGYEVAGRSFIFELLQTARKQHLQVDPDTARIDMRDEIGCSRATSYSIMERLVGGSRAPLTTGRDQRTGESGLRFLNSNCYNMTLEQVNAEYPARGNLSKKGVTFD